MLIHCGQGVSRAPSVAVAWLMVRHRWDYDRALARVRLTRTVASPNVGFMCQLLEWQDIIGVNDDAAALGGAVEVRSDEGGGGLPTLAYAIFRQSQLLDDPPLVAFPVPFSRLDILNPDWCASRFCSPCVRRDFFATCLRPVGRSPLPTPPNARCLWKVLLYHHIEPHAAAVARADRGTAGPRGARRGRRPAHHHPGPHRGGRRGQ